MSTSDKFAEIDSSIDEMHERLKVIARQNAALGEMVEVLGGYVNTSIELQQQHASDGHGNLSP